ncbi:hypothetical protein OF122_12955 [Pelagibacterium flavum]|uniref:Uncharacterized protein n=1 Tax=Pelagibacterium flavum TaxID=2984530 RepID=A0ABY6IK37_9HYPH|nr:hypothetical protein [Pelagibacterium sp. YIM 151497]UYQ70967.1 hypothetical protein OF122_12955 [Pelagibacterium sp. YIM 151497]
MSFTFPVGSVITAKVKLTGNTATTLVDADTGRVTILSIDATETQGGTPNLTIDVTDGTTTWFKRNAAAMTAKGSVTYDDVFILDNGETLRATSSDASGDIDIFVTYAALGIAGRGAGSLVR